MFYYKTEKYREALSDIEVFLMSKPQHKRVMLYYKSRCELQTGNYAKSIEGFTEFISTNPQAHHVYMERGNAYKAIGHFSNAIADFSIAMQKTTWKPSKDKIQTLINETQQLMKQSPPPMQAPPKQEVKPVERKEEIKQASKGINIV